MQEATYAAVKLNVAWIFAPVTKVNTADARHKKKATTQAIDSRVRLTRNKIKTGVERIPTQPVTTKKLVSALNLVSE